MSVSVERRSKLRQVSGGRGLVEEKGLLYDEMFRGFRDDSAGLLRNDANRGFGSRQCGLRLDHVTDVGIVGKYISDFLGSEDVSKHAGVKRGDRHSGNRGSCSLGL